MRSLLESDRGISPQPPSKVGSQLMISRAAFNALRELMKRHSGILLADHKGHLVVNRLSKRLRTLNLQDFEAYVSYLRQYPEERQQAIDLLTTNETRFFREPRHFEVLTELAMRRVGSGFRVWSAACSSGEEPYTIAMVLAHTRSGKDWDVLGTDLSHSVLAKARQAIYAEREASSIPRDWLVRYCLKGVGEMTGQFQIKPALRRTVRFRPINLNEALPQDLGQFDVIFLRNVLIYFDAETKRRIVQRVLNHLPKGGHLLIGHSETLHSFDLPVKTVAPSVYQKQ